MYPQHQNGLMGQGLKTSTELQDRGAQTLWNAAFCCFWLPYQEWKLSVGLLGRSLSTRTAKGKKENSGWLSHHIPQSGRQRPVSGCQIEKEKEREQPSFLSRLWQGGRQVTFSLKWLFSLQIPVSMAASRTFKIFLTTEWTGKCCGFQLQKTKKKNYQKTHISPLLLLF